MFMMNNLHLHVVSLGRAWRVRRNHSPRRAWLATVAVLISGVVAVGIGIGFINPPGCVAAGVWSLEASAPISAALSNNAFPLVNNANFTCFTQTAFANRTAVFDELDWMCSVRFGGGPVKEVNMSLERNTVNPGIAKPADSRINTTRVRRIGAVATFEKLESRQLMSVAMPGPLDPVGMVSAPLGTLALQQAVDASLNQVQNNAVVSNTDTGSSSSPTSLPAQLQSSPVAATFNSKGLASLSYNGVKIFDGTANPYDGFRVIDYTLIQPNGTRVHQFANVYTTTWNAATQTIAWNFDWGSVSCKYTAQSDRLGMQLTINNTSNNTVAGVNAYTVAVRFPGKPVFGGGGAGISFGTNEPGAASADFTTGTAAIVNDGAPSPLYLGFVGAGALTATANRYEVRVGTTAMNGSPTSWPTFDVPLAAHTSSTYNVSLRFAAGHTAQATIASDAYQQFAAANPATLTWTDHRAIGELFPSGSGAASRSATNPNGWFNDPTVNVTTPAGLAAFRTRLLAYADASVAILKQMNAQGAITWDIEGEQYSRADYIGDPRLATTFAPELAYQNVVDAYFKKFTDAGLRVGVTLRPQTIQYDKNGPYQVDSTNVAQTLIDKINYAKTRWGCTLFYVDSTEINMDGAVFKQVMDAVPGILLIPENQNLKDFAYTAPYDEVRGGVTSTSADVRAVFPNAVTVIEASAGPALTTAQAQQLQTAVNNGDILLFPAWYNAASNSIVKSIYSAKSASKSAAALPTSQSAVAAPATTTASTDTSDNSTTAPVTTSTFSDTIIGTTNRHNRRGSQIIDLLRAA